MSRVLIAEDEPRIASFIEKGLRANGFSTSVAADGGAARAQAASGEFDLLVLDIGLPVMDGFEVLRRLRAERNPIPVIILTARDSVQDTVAGTVGWGISEGSGSFACPGYPEEARGEDRGRPARTTFLRVPLRRSPLSYPGRPGWVFLGEGG